MRYTPIVGSGATLITKSDEVVSSLLVLVVFFAVSSGGCRCFLVLFSCYYDQRDLSIILYPVRSRKTSAAAHSNSIHDVLLHLLRNRRRRADRAVTVRRALTHLHHAVDGISAAAPDTDHLDTHMMGRTLV